MESAQHHWLLGKRKLKPHQMPLHMHQSDNNKTSDNTHVSEWQKTLEL